jgi:hypothetical protein
MAESRRLVNPFCFGLGCLFLNAFHNRNGWIYFIGAALSPVLTASFLAMFAFNPYHTPAAKFSGMTNLDERDAVAQRLVSALDIAARRNARHCIPAIWAAELDIKRADCAVVSSADLIVLVCDASNLCQFAPLLVPS